VTGVTRRRFLAGSTLAWLAAACTSDGATGPDHDLDTAAAAAALETLAFDLYTATSLRATNGHLGAANPPAVGTFLVTAAGHHRAALDSWNTLLEGAGRAPVTAPKEALRLAVDTANAKVADIVAAATLLLRVEDYASQTYQKAIPTLQRPETIRLAAEISLVGHQRQAVLRYLLGFDPVGSGTSRQPSGLPPADPNPRLITG
jgi:hypothetical protein